MNDGQFFSGIQRCKLTPFIVAEEQRTLVQMLRRYPGAFAGKAIDLLERNRPEDGPTLRTERMIDLLPVALESADVILWKESMWRAAMEGKEIFRSQPATAIYKGISPQIWYFSDFALMYGEDRSDARTRMRLNLIILPVAGVSNADTALDMESVEYSGRYGYTLIEVCGDSAQVGEALRTPSRACPYLLIYPPRFEDEPPLPVDIFMEAAAGLEFMRLEIVNAERFHWPKATRKIAARKREHLPTIRTVALRRREASAAQKATHGGVDWQHQWLVRGHWRNQFYPATDTHAPKYIAPYVKGPDGAPLKQPAATIFEVKR